jgi:hypothetical protein
MYMFRDRTFDTDDVPASYMDRGHHDCNDSVHPI